MESDIIRIFLVIQIIFGFVLYTREFDNSNQVSITIVILTSNSVHNKGGFYYEMEQLRSAKTNIESLLK